MNSLPAEPQGKPKNTGVGSLSLLQWIFLTQESNQGLLHCRQILKQLSYQESPHMHNGGGGLVTKSCPTLVTPWTIACQASLSIGFSRQEYWSGMPFHSPGCIMERTKWKEGKNRKNIWNDTGWEFPLMSDTKPQTQEVQNSKQDKRKRRRKKEKKKKTTPRHIISNYRKSKIQS